MEPMTPGTDFRIVRETAAFEYPFSLIDRIWEELSTPWEPDPRLAELTAGQSAIYSLHWTQAEVLNGGFRQLFSNPTGYLIPEAIAGVHLLASAEWEALLSKAVEPLGTPFPREHENRIDRLGAVSDESKQLLDECDSRFYELDEAFETSLHTLFDRYVEAHPEDFFLDAVDDATAADALLTTARKVINSKRHRDLDLAEQLLRESIRRAAGSEPGRTEALAQSLLDQIPMMRS